jgi:hypothetical protein
VSNYAELTSLAAIPVNDGLKPEDENLFRQYYFTRGLPENILMENIDFNEDGNVIWLLIRMESINFVIIFYGRSRETSEKFSHPHPGKANPDCSAVICCFLIS